MTRRRARWDVWVWEPRGAVGGLWIRSGANVPTPVATVLVELLDGAGAIVAATEHGRTPPDPPGKLSDEPWRPSDGRMVSRAEAIAAVWARALLS